VIHNPRILVLGASGRLGAILQRHWCDTEIHPIWQFRAAPVAPPPSGEYLVFDPLEGPPAQTPVDIVLGLAGIVQGKGALSRNTDLALATVRCAHALGARNVMLSSSAAVYGVSEHPHCEDVPASPLSAYGRAKIEMEIQALALAQRYGIEATALRIGNVAGADALLGQSGSSRILDRFDSGQGPVRSYIGPNGLSTVLQALTREAWSGATLPRHLNIALKGGVGMEDLCQAAGLDVTWQRAPETAVEKVVLDVTRLAGLVPVPEACATAVVADWRADRDKQ